MVIMPEDEYYNEEEEIGWGPKNIQEFFTSYALLIIVAFLWLVFRGGAAIKDNGGL